MYMHQKVSELCLLVPYVPQVVFVDVLWAMSDDTLEVEHCLLMLYQPKGLIMWSTCMLHSMMNTFMRHINKNDMKRDLCVESVHCWYC